jgi:integrase
MSYFCTIFQMNHRQIAAGGIRVYSRHSDNCNRNSAHVKCDCPKWLQYQVDGRQVRESAKTRSFTQAVIAAEKKAKELSGEVPVTASKVTVEQAVKDWLAFRAQEGMNSEKPRLMSGRLLAFCKEKGITFLSGITAAHLTALRATLPYRTTTSSSLKIHWSVLGGFFGWSVTAGHLTANPMPKFKTKFKKPPVVPPTTAEVNRVLAVESVRVFASLLRYSGLAIQDAATLKRDALVGNLITGNRAKTHESFRVRIPMWLADELRGLAGDEYFFWNGRVKVTSVVHHYRALLVDAFKKAGVKMTPHGFRHYFISATLATGVLVEDVSAMVGTSPNEIRKTYRHWIKEATDRLDEVQQQAWIKQGLDADGNPKTAAVN